MSGDQHTRKKGMEGKEGKREVGGHRGSGATKEGGSRGGKESQREGGREKGKEGGKREI